ncbi:unnamed protein product [Calypogeia fissa]
MDEAEHKESAMEVETHSSRIRSESTKDDATATIIVDDYVQNVTTSPLRGMETVRGLSEDKEATKEDVTTTIIEEAIKPITKGTTNEEEAPTKSRPRGTEEFNLKKQKGIKEARGTQLDNLIIKLDEAYKEEVKQVLAENANSQA